MSKDIRKMIDKVKNFKQFINENNETTQYINVDDIKTEKEMILVDTKMLMILFQHQEVVKCPWINYVL